LRFRGGDLTCLTHAHPDTKPKPRESPFFPGQFDPITNGHLDVIRRGVHLFDELIVAVGVNPRRKELFTLQERSDMIRTLLKGLKGVRVEQYTGLTMDFVRQVKAIAILRGIRDVSDLRYEFQIAQANRAVGEVETVFIMTGDQYALTSSSLIRQVVSLGGDVRKLSGLLPDSGRPPAQEEAAAAHSRPPRTGRAGRRETGFQH
jgi:pantetheine-phosphate adenylyltransferase